MTKEDEIQIKKDTLWDIHESEKRLACLQSKLSRMMENVEEIYRVWKNKSLGTVNNKFVDNSKAIPGSVPNFPENEYVHEVLNEIQITDQRLNKLNKDFERM